MSIQPFSRSNNLVTHSYMARGSIAGSYPPAPRHDLEQTEVRGCGGIVVHLHAEQIWCEDRPTLGMQVDEPTNHLDAESVAWLERTLNDFRGTVVAITHDRCAPYLVTEHSPFAGMCPCLCRCHRT